MRKIFVNTLIKEAYKNKNIYLLTADLGFSLFEDFKREFPGRFINVGVAEQNMIGMATGLALMDKIVFVYSLAVFATMRPFEQIRSAVALHGASVIIVGGSSGLSSGYDGVTHHSLEDIALMRSIPGMTVIYPADPIETIWATKILANLKKPAYLRLGKRKEHIIHDKNPGISLGRGVILEEGERVVVIAAGPIAFNAFKGAALLKKQGVNPSVVSMPTVKPIDGDLIKKLAVKFELIVTVEEHNIIGGLGSAVSEVLSSIRSNSSLLRLGIADKFIFDIGNPSYLRVKAGLDPVSIAKAIQSQIRRKK